MTALLNFIWFVLGGGLIALFWLIISGLFYLTLIGAPIGRACLEFAKLSALPFGKEIVRIEDVQPKNKNTAGWKILHAILNIFWLLIGIGTTITYFIAGVLSCISLVGIPVGIVYIRMGKFLIFPVGARVVKKKNTKPACCR